METRRVLTLLALTETRSVFTIVWTEVKHQVPHPGARQGRKRPGACSEQNEKGQLPPPWPIKETTESSSTDHSGTENSGVIVADAAGEDAFFLDLEKLRIQATIRFSGTDIVSVLRQMNEMTDDIETRDGRYVLDNEDRATGDEDTTTLAKDFANGRVVNVV
jgi:hypothetical protein